MQVNQTAYTFYTTYVWVYGIEGAEVAAAPGTALEAVSVAAPSCYKVVCWVAQAQDGGDPQPPDWNTGTTNEVLTKKAITSTFLMDIGDGTTANTIAGIYEYLLLIPPSDTDYLSFGGPPWDASLANLIQPSTFLKLLNLPNATNPTGQGTYGGKQSGNGLIQKNPGD